MLTWLTGWVAQGWRVGAWGGRLRIRYPVGTVKTLGSGSERERLASWTASVPVRGSLRVTVRFT